MVAAVVVVAGVAMTGRTGEVVVVVEVVVAAMALAALRGLPALTGTGIMCRTGTEKGDLVCCFPLLVAIGRRCGHKAVLWWRSGTAAVVVLCSGGLHLVGHRSAVFRRFMGSRQ